MSVRDLTLGALCIGAVLCAYAFIQAGISGEELPQLTLEYILLIGITVLLPYSVLGWKAIKAERNAAVLLVVSVLLSGTSGFFVVGFLQSTDPSRALTLVVVCAIILMFLVIGLLVPTRVPR